MTTDASLIQITLKFQADSWDTTVDVTAEQVTEHLCVHPAVEITESGKPRYATAAWAITHITTGRVIAPLYESGPDEWPGEPRAVDLDNARRFAQWFEPRMNWEATPFRPAAGYDTETVRQACRDFISSPNYWRRSLRIWVTPPEPPTGEQVCPEVGQ